MSKRFLTLLCAMVCLTFSQAFAVTYYTYVNGGSTGFWANASTWTTDPTGLTLTGSAVPGNGDVVVILNGYTVTLNANVVTTGHSISINSGGVLNLSTFSITALGTLSGAGTLRINAGYFPSVTTNNFANSAASGATVEYFDFTGTLAAGIIYPNLIFRNTTASNHVMTIPNAAAYAMSVGGTFVTSSLGTGSLSVVLGTAATNVISLSVMGNVTIGANTRLATGVFNAIHTISLNGNLTNNGTVDLSNGTQYTTSATGAANVTFTGSSNNTLACNGTTDLYTLTVNKGSASTYTLSVTSTNSANLNFYSSGQLITISNGTLRLGANINIPRVYGTGTANYDVGSSSARPMLWIDGATVNTNTCALVVYGKFRITSGTFTCVGGQGTVIREEGQYIIEGGTFTTEKFRPSTTASTHRGSFIMSGGVLNASGTTGSDNRYARFSLPYPEQVFIMSGGVINVSNPQSGGAADDGGIHIGCSASNYTVTGGTFNAILSGSATLFNICSVPPLYNLTITRTGGPGTVRLAGIGSVSGTITTAQPLEILNDLTIDGTNSPDLDSEGLEVTVGGNFTIASGGTYIPDGNTTTFNGSADQTFSNSGTITSGLYNLMIDKSGTVTLAGSATSFTVANTLTLLNGILNDGGKTVIALGDVENESTHTGSGSITFQGSATQTVSGDDSGVFGNVVLDNASSPGVMTTCDITISGTLTLAGAGNSLFAIDENLLYLTSSSVSAVTTTGSGFSSAKMIRTLGFQSDKGVRKTYGNLSAFTFPFGAGTKYTPATIQLTATPTAYGDITARPVNSAHPLNEDGIVNNLQFYWKVESAGFIGVGVSGVSHVYTYLDADVTPGGDDVNYIPARYFPASWTPINDVAQVNEGTNQILFTSVGYIDGEFTAGVPASFGIVRIFYSKRSGSWTDTGAGTTPWSNVSHTGADAGVSPTAGDYVYIGDASGNNHTITVGSANQSCGGLEIAGGSVLDLGTTTGHNFGVAHIPTVGGAGKLRISSSAATAQFPAGDFGNFIRSSGGTVEYYSTGGTNYNIPLSSAAPSSLPLTSYRYLILSPSTARVIRLPNQNLQIFGDLTVEGAATGRGHFNITSETIVTINGNLNVTSGILRFNNAAAQTVEVLGNVTVGSGASFDHGSTGAAAANSMTIHGNLVNNGTFDMANTASYVCNVTFTGNSNTSITGTGGTTDFNVLTVSKGTSQTPVLNVNASAFTLSGGTLPLVLESGTFRLTSAQTVTIASGVDFNVPTSARLSLNGGVLEITGGDGTDLLLSGTLEMLAGTLNVGTTANDNAIEYAATGSPAITASGGTLNVRGQIRRSVASSQGNLSFTSSGTAVINAGISAAAATTRGVFEILNSGVFTMSGGTLNVVRPNGATSIADLYLFPASSAVTGGTVEIGNGVTTEIIDINTAIALHNVTVMGASNIARLESNPLTLRGSLTIGAGAFFNANSQNVSIAGNFVNNNTSNASSVTAGGYRPGSVSQTTTFNGSTASQTISGVSGNLSSFGNLVIANTFAGGTVTLLANSTVRVNGTLTLSSGTIEDGGNIIGAAGTIINSSTHTSVGGGAIRLVGSSTQLITGNGNGKFGNFQLNNAAGGSFGADQEVTGTITFFSGSLSIGAHQLYLSNTSPTALSGTSSARFITTGGNLSDDGILKAVAANVTTESFTFPVGVGTKYTPAAFTLTTGGTGGTLRLKPVNTRHPNATGTGSAFLDYYWNVTSTGVTVSSATHVYTYDAADISGDPALYFDARFQAGTWTVGSTPGNPNTVTREMTFLNTTLTADYTAGEPTAFVDPTTYTSIASGSWDSDLAVWDNDPPGSNLGPPAGSVVIISAGHTVTVPTNGKTTGSIDILGTLALGTTTGHDFGTVNTSGAGARTIQLQTSTFPLGNFAAFTASGGGTVEYNGALSLPTQAVYNNLVFSGAGTKTLANSDLTINGDLTITTGTVTNAVNNRNITLTDAAADFLNLGTFDAGNGSISIAGNFINSGASASFFGGDGTDGMIVSGDFLNDTGATFVAASDSIGVRGDLTNSGTFTASTGAIRVTGDLLNTSGTFTGGSGLIEVKGDVVNNAAFTGGTGSIAVRSDMSNSGASASFSLGSATATVNGDFFNLAGATGNGGTGALTVLGDWQNSATYNPGTGTVNFSATGGQTLSGATSFYNLTRTGGTLAVNDNVSVSNLLTLSAAIVSTGSNTISLTNTGAQPVTGYSSSAFVDGRISIAYPDGAGATRVFPIGSGSVYRPVTIYQTAASTAAVVRTSMINTPPTGTYPASVGSLSEARYFSIDLVSGTMNSPRIEIGFNTNGTADENITAAGNARVMRATASGGPWTDEGGTQVFSPAAPAGFVTSGNTTIVNPTFFTLAYQVNALPITLSYFVGELADGEVRLQWATESEKENDYFVIEKSSSELKFDSIGFVKGLRDSHTRVVYNHRDSNPLPGVSYYRLRQVDADGSFSSSNIVRIVNDELPYLAIYPVPVSHGQDLYLQMKNQKPGLSRIVVTDVTGRAIFATEAELSFERKLSDFNLSLPPGVYVIQVNSGTLRTSKKIVVE